MITRVVNLRRERFDVYIGRSKSKKAGYFGNPFKVAEGGRARAIQRYRDEYFLVRVEQDAEFRAAVLGLRGKRLGCHCKPEDCHGDIIVEWLEANP